MIFIIMKEFLKKRIQECMVMELLETMVDEDYPTSFNMEHFKTLRTFADRVRYCEANLQRISSGSSRIVYKIDNEKVLKLAKNEKGIAQDETEIQWGNDSYFTSILARTLDYHPDNLWVEMELARKVRKTEFFKEFGFTIDDLGRYLRNFEEQNKGGRPFYHMDPEIKSRMGESEFVNNMMDFMNSTGSPAGDFGRLNSYGIVKRDGHDSIVLVDFGLTHDVYASYYS